MKKHILFIVIGLFCSVASFCQSGGTFDLSFGNNGIASYNTGTNNWVWSVKIQPDGKIIAGGSTNDNFCVARFNNDGSPDNTFATGGYVITDFGATEWCNSIALQSDGKILAAGYTSDWTTFSSIALVRYNDDGSLDNTFGTGGKVITNINSYNLDKGMAVTVNPSGKIIVSGSSVIGVNDNAFVIVQYNSDGSIDSNFGTNGNVLVDFGTYDMSTSMQLQPDGYIIAAGCSGNLGYADFALVRLKPDGVIDSSFGANGKVLTDMGANDSIYSVALQPDGKIIAAGSSSIPAGMLHWVMARFNSDGSLDNTFGSAGKVILSSFGASAQNYCYAVSLQSNGKILLGGSLVISGIQNTVTLLRFNSNGSTDNTFGTNGIAETRSGWEWCTSLAIEPNGKILEGGIFNNKFGVARYYSENNITGKIFNDANGNGAMDGTEQGIAGQIVKLEPGPVYIVTNNDGYYGFAKDTGVYSISLISQPYWALTTDSAVYSVDVIPGNYNITGLDFGLQAISNIKDLAVYYTGDQPRIFLDIEYWLHYKNAGTTTEQGSVYLNYDSLLTFISSNVAPVSHIGNQLEWSYDTLASGEERQIFLLFTAPGINSVGDTLNSFCRIESIAGDTDLTNNCDTLSQEVTGSFDPNDKSVSPAGKGIEGYVLHGQKLTYTVRFQNTGNDTAYTVAIIDSIDTNMDIESFSLLAASHPVCFTIEGANVVKFTFDNILLPDSNINEPGSHGFVKYSLKPKPNLSNYTEVNNQALIFFDNNPAIITNTTTNTYVSAAVMGIQEANKTRELNIYPNPASYNLTIEAAKESQIEILNIQGQLLLSKSLIQEITEIDVSGLARGMYFIKVECGESVSIKKFIKE